MNVALSRLVIAAQTLRRMQTDLAVVLHQFQKVLSINEIHMAGGRRLSRGLVRHARDRRAQTRDSPASVVLRMRILPSRDVVESQRRVRG